MLSIRTLTPVLALFLCNCATIATRPRYTGFGEADFSRDRKVVERFEANRFAPPPTPAVKVLLDTLPEGLSMKEGVLEVDEGYTHEVIGKFRLTPQNPVETIYGFANYKDGWRKALCYPQVPLVWVTLSMWFAVPTYYPCFGTIAQDREQLTEEVKHMAEAAGGDAAIVTFLEPPMMGREEVYGAQGYILRLDPRASTGKSRALQKPKQKDLFNDI